MHDARRPLCHWYIKAKRVHPSISLWIVERMIGVKRSANTITTPKSTKNKKARTNTLPDSDDAPVKASPHNESTVPTPVPDCEFGPPFDGLYDQDMALELPDTLPLLMRFRYQLLLEKARPEERLEGTPPHLSWLETKYGHLVEKPVWYNRLVKLANTYLQVQPRDERGFKDKTLGELENAVGHLVPYTEGEKEFLQLLEKLKKSRVQLAGEPDLTFLRHAKPPSAAYPTSQERADQVPPPAPEYLPNHVEGEEVMSYVPVEEALLSCLNTASFTPQIRVRMYVFNVVKPSTPSSTLDSLTEPSSTTASTPQE